MQPVSSAHSQGVDKFDGRLQNWPLAIAGHLLLSRLSPYRSRRFLLVGIMVLAQGSMMQLVFGTLFSAVFLLFQVHTST